MGLSLDSVLKTWTQRCEQVQIGANTPVFVNYQRTYQNKRVGFVWEGDFWLKLLEPSVYPTTRVALIVETLANTCRVLDLPHDIVNHNPVVDSRGKVWEGLLMRNIGYTIGDAMKMGEMSPTDALTAYWSGMKNALKLARSGYYFGDPDLSNILVPIIDGQFDLKKAFLMDNLECLEECLNIPLDGTTNWALVDAIIFNQFVRYAGDHDLGQVEMTSYPDVLRLNTAEEALLSGDVTCFTKLEPSCCVDEALNQIKGTDFYKTSNDFIVARCEDGGIFIGGISRLSTQGLGSQDKVLRLKRKLERLEVGK